MSFPKRPLLRYFGGKFRHADKIVAMMPEHSVYVEPFGGAASVLLRKPRAKFEIYNDQWDEVVNLFRVLQTHGVSKELQQRLTLTPFSRTVFDEAYLPADTSLVRAFNLIVRSFMGHGPDSCFKKSGFRANSNRSGSSPAKDWANYTQSLDFVVERLKGVTIENQCALECMSRHDRGPETLHYLDPPYMAETRSSGEYAIEMDEAQHEALLNHAKSMAGAVLISGYSSELYETNLADWHRCQWNVQIHNGLSRTEVLWSNRPLPVDTRPRQGELLCGGSDA